MRKILFSFIFIVACSFIFSQEWKALVSSRQNELTISVLSSSSSQVKLAISIPGYYQRKLQAGGKECLLVRIPRAPMYVEKHCPFLPKLAKFIKVPKNSDVKFEVISKEEVDVKLEAPIIPSKGYLTRDINPASVPFVFGKVYEEDAYWPAKENQFKVGKKFMFRDLCGMRMRIIPFRVNHVQKNMKVLKKITVALNFTQQRYQSYAPSIPSEAKPGKNYKKLYRSTFVNYSFEETTTEQAATRSDAMPDANNNKMVIVCHHEFSEAVQNWMIWKKKAGMKIISFISVNGNTAQSIKDQLQELYNSTDTRFGYVVLIGDSGQIPTFQGSKEYADADRVYVRLAGDDNFPDAFISRISANSVSEVTAQLDKIMAYEQGTIDITGNWMAKGLCIASDEGTPTDYERAEWLQVGSGGEKIVIEEGGLEKYGYSFTDIYAPGATASNVAQAVNEGVSIICYIGHGSTDSWVTSGFHSDDIPNLTNNNMYPVIWSVACVNGNFVNTTCFAETWLRKANGGAVAMEASTTNESWIPPCDKQAATINAIINGEYFTFGALEAHGCIVGLENYGATDGSEGNKMAEQCTLFGDCTMLVRTKKASSITVTEVKGDTEVTFTVKTGNAALANATITVYDDNFSYTSTGVTNSSGQVSITLPENAGTLKYTVVAPNIVPIIDAKLSE